MIDRITYNSLTKVCIKRMSVKYGVPEWMFWHNVKSASKAGTGRPHEILRELNSIMEPLS